MREDAGVGFNISTVREASPRPARGVLGAGFVAKLLAGSYRDAQGARRVRMPENEAAIDALGAPSASASSCEPCQEAVRAGGEDMRCLDRARPRVLPRQWPISDPARPSLYAVRQSRQYYRCTRSDARQILQQK